MTTKKWRISKEAGIVHCGKESIIFIALWIPFFKGITIVSVDGVRLVHHLTNVGA